MTAGSSLGTVRRIVIPPIERLRLPRGGPIEELCGATMGTTWSVRLVAHGALDPPGLARSVERELETVVEQMSPWRADSDISLFNRAPPGSEQRLPEPFFTVLAYALETARDSGGAYDPTVGPLVDLWGFGPPGPRRAPPSSFAIDGARHALGWNRIVLDASQRTARQPGGVRLDLSAVAKGYAVDRVAALLRGREIESFLVEIGGELRGEGVKPDGQPWWIALERPGPADAAVETVVALHRLSVATSGDYRKCFEFGGVRYAHTIDPRTARPVASDVVSVTVIHADCMAADALSTALYVLGPKAGLDFAADRGLAALFVRRIGAGVAEVLTPAFATMLE